MNLTRRALRMRSRGAVFVEAIVVLTFFILCFLGVAYFRELYLAKMRVQRLARASAMAHAMGACRTDPRAGLEKDLPVRPLESRRDPGTAPRIDTQGDKTAEDSLATLERSKGGGGPNEITTIRITTSAEATTKNAQTGKREGFESDVASTSFVTCADVTSPDQYGEILPRVQSIFDSIF